MIYKIPDSTNITSEDPADQPHLPSERKQTRGCLVGCLGLILFIFITELILVTLGGWVWWHIMGLVILFIIVRAFSHNIIALAIATVSFGIIVVLFNVFDIVQRPLIFDHDTPQRNDFKVMKEVFRLSDLPPSFKISKVRWRGEDWFPSQGLRTSEYRVDVNARDINQLLSKVSKQMKSVEPDLSDFYFMMDENLRDSIRADNYDHKGQHQWKQFEIEIKDKLETIRWSIDLGWDEKTSPSLQLYIHVIPEAL